ncbi:Bifunctional protein Aas [Phycisphaerae bacterium RAS1]|nr:Bifunctional protein Aas [Phycisphaerae bacterium RAS1]
MIDPLLRGGVRAILSLRYRIRVSGLDAVRQRGRSSILFLPNHPALIDPVIIMTVLHRDFAPHALADREQTETPGFRWLLRRVGVRPILSMADHGPAAKGAVEQVVRGCIDELRTGNNILLYPSGHIYRTRLEDLRGNSAVEMILSELPDLRIVLIRTRGLWGSSFGCGAGRMPDFTRSLRRGVGVTLANGLILTPRRRVSIELFEPPDLPRREGRTALNAYIERFYNEDAPPQTRVPYYFWQGSRPRELPDPPQVQIDGSPAEVPETTRQLVLEHLKQAAGATAIRDSDRLAHDLNLDSLARAELLLWLSREFGSQVSDVAALQTVGDVMLAARGQAGGGRAVELKPVPRRWSRHRATRPPAIPPGDTITQVFLAQARASAGRAAIADQLGGVRSYRDVITGILLLRPHIAALPGQRVGIMLPASAAANVVYLATLFAGKTPVMLNWTTGVRNLAHALEVTGAQRIITVAPLVARIEMQGTDLGPIMPRLTFLDKIAAGFSTGKKLAAAARARLSWGELERATPPDIAAILLTSGSEALPKAVPLTHRNVLTNLRDVVTLVRLQPDDCIIGFLPPFHSFGLVVTTLLPMLLGLRAVYHSNPTEAAVIAQLIRAYRATVLMGTPTFLYGIVRAAPDDALRSLRIAVTGAEKCPPRTYEALAAKCPSAVIIEGYGITECSPIVSAHSQDLAIPGTIGRILPSLRHAIVDPDSGQDVPTGRTGLLLVRGPSVFSGYLNADVASPFVRREGKDWYRTGDLVSEDERGILTFRGRLKRFVKLGGEMISLPAIEAVLEKHFASESDEGPVLAVDATASEEHPEIVLFTTRDIDRQTANTHIRAAQLSALHNITRVVRLDAIPVLGTGKTDYRALRATLEIEGTSLHRNKGLRDKGIKG